MSAPAGAPEVRTEVFRNLIGGEWTASVAGKALATSACAQ